MHRTVGLILISHTKVDIPRSFKLGSTRVSAGGKGAISIVIGWLFVANLRSDAIQ